MWPMGVERSGNRHASTATPRCARNIARCAHCELLPLRSSPSSTISAPRLLQLLLPLLLRGDRAAAEGVALPPAIAIADASRWYATPATMPCPALRNLRSQASERRSLDLAGVSYIRRRGRVSVSVIPSGG